MIQVLALNSEASGTSRIRHRDVEVTVERFARRLVAQASSRVFNLLVLSNLEPESASRVAGRVQRFRAWRHVPVLYVLPPGAPGIILPGAYRMELDGIVVGLLDSESVFDAMREHALPAVDPFPSLSFGPYELDRAAHVLRWGDSQAELTARESEVMAVLFGADGDYVSPAGIARQLSQPADGNPASAGLARRYVSRLRARLADVPGAPRVSSLRNAGYRVEVPRGAAGRAQ
ncbi:MAG: hypothetical protein ACE5EF_09575 [Dehalococcoidia bacterium]